MIAMTRLDAAFVCALGVVVMAAPGAWAQTAAAKHPVAAFVSPVADTADSAAGAADAALTEILAREGDAAGLAPLDRDNFFSKLASKSARKHLEATQKALAEAKLALKTGDIADTSEKLSRAKNFADQAFPALFDLALMRDIFFYTGIANHLDRKRKTAWENFRVSCSIDPTDLSNAEGMNADVLKVYLMACPRKRSPAVGILRVNSTPAGATVYVDGTYAGVTPLNIENVPAGEHFVQTLRTGYKAKGDRVNVPAGMGNTYSAQLAPDLRRNWLQEFAQVIPSSGKEEFLAAVRKAMVELRVKQLLSARIELLGGTVQVDGFFVDNATATEKIYPVAENFVMPAGEDYTKLGDEIAILLATKYLQISHRRALAALKARGMYPPRPAVVAEQPAAATPQTQTKAEIVTTRPTPVLKIVGWSAFGVGVAMAGGGIGFAVKAKSNYDELVIASDEGKPKSTITELTNNQNKYNKLADILMISGAAVATTGLVLALISGSRGGSGDDAPDAGSAAAPSFTVVPIAGGAEARLGASF